MLLVAFVACGGASGPAPSAPPAAGSAVDQTDQTYCAFDRQRHERCGPPTSSPFDEQQCLERSCQLRVNHGAQLADGIKNCLLQRPCGANNQDTCFAMVLGPHAQSPAAQRAASRCTSFEQRCGPFQVNAKPVQCRWVAHLGAEVTASLDPCFDLACALGQQCATGAITRSLVSCDLPDRPR